MKFIISLAVLALVGGKRFDHHKHNHYGSRLAQSEQKKWDTEALAVMNEKDYMES